MMDPAELFKNMDNMNFGAKGQNGGGDPMLMDAVNKLNLGGASKAGAGEQDFDMSKLPKVSG